MKTTDAGQKAGVWSEYALPIYLHKTNNINVCVHIATASTKMNGIAKLIHRCVSERQQLAGRQVRAYEGICRSGICAAGLDDGLEGP